MHITPYCSIIGVEKIPAKKNAYVKAALHQEIQQAIEDGYTWFCAGFNEGEADLLFVQTVLQHKVNHPDELILDALITPNVDMSNMSNSVQDLLYHCDAIRFLYEGECTESDLQQNFELLRVSGRIIAVCGDEKTALTMRYARSLNKEVRPIRIRNKRV
ncbi:hypothetical protein NE562_04800 [Butyricicoccus faecihominis]|uniref:hypothetical protein n=1 Tax=Butyricicoccus faecihominis TaxID=1712515 RepID=UPI00247B0121|nr:hypothetical protein [Butyricicoccus faecihominis]MCQ5128968.1 hypothetical protein [Butyricicoccus faecihominis]